MSGAEMDLGDMGKNGIHGGGGQATEVVNCKVCYIRPEYHDLKEWCEDPRNCYIGRKGVVFIGRPPETDDDPGMVKKERYPKKDSVFANPFRLKLIKGNSEESRAEILNLYEEYIIDKIEKEGLYEELRALKGKRLGCWCKEKGRNVGCHGDILLKLLERLEESPRNCTAEEKSVFKNP